MKLFIPGPVTVKEDVLNQMATALIGHRTQDASQLQESITRKLQKLMYTKNEILLSTTSGSGLMEGTIRSLTKKKAAVFSIGAFGDRWFKMAKVNNIEADKFSVPMGEATTPKMVEDALKTGEYDLVTITHNETSTGVMNPIYEISEIVKKYPDVIFCVDAVSSLGGVKIPVDELGIDVCITSTQKCLGLPPGLAICSISDKGINRAKGIGPRGMYLDLLSIYEYLKKKHYQYPSTPNLSLMFALDYQLGKILDEGLENRFNRHLEMANYVRDWAKENFDLFADENHLSNTLTTIKNTKEISIKDLNKKLETRGFLISNGYGDLKEKTFRIAHMADTTLDEVKELLNVIEEFL
ncbi:pyridoxal-phosphate-dependent aminotransferase family protein [Anaeromicrobium sediminis]|uniref:Aminotransferase n=1 Tax=Anaeromicrobium sediminis TaxID=1478221 RepID=A0A267MG14_9FIRM|nr:alanine--glyoxylate aminotransferase family protein [Anaeromicrobium sediminis]PAB58407.1 aminotransferase [Anaeromicrobium sediminis]